MPELISQHDHQASGASETVNGVRVIHAHTASEHTVALNWVYSADGPLDIWTAAAVRYFPHTFNHSHPGLLKYATLWVGERTHVPSDIREAMAVRVLPQIGYSADAPGLQGYSDAFAELLRRYPSSRYAGDARQQIGRASCRERV